MTARSPRRIAKFTASKPAAVPGGASSHTRSDGRKRIFDLKRKALGSIGAALLESSLGALGCQHGQVPPDAREAGVGAPIALTDFCAVFTADLCGFLITCGGAAYCNVTHCVTENECYGMEQLTGAVDSGAVRYDAAEVGTCEARFRTDPCGFGPLPPLPTVFDVLAQCPLALTPQLASGQACVSSIECGVGLTCNKTGNVCPGVCAPRINAGGPCEVSETCAAGLVCNAAHVCQRAAYAGASCSSNDGCAAVAPCAAATDVQPLTPCHGANLWCDLTMQVCRDGVAQGEACGATAAGQTACAEGLWCDATGVGQTGMCRAPGPSGAPCDVRGGCDTGLRCVSSPQLDAGTTAGQCAPPAAMGGACEITDDCAAGLACLAGSCAEPLAIGARCNSNPDCQAGLTCATEKCLKPVCPAAACADPDSTCVLGVCNGGVCQAHAKIGHACAAGADCTTGACSLGRCVDTSVCVAP
jgi:hypothetical protein